MQSKKNVIDSFTGDYRFLSNFHPVEIVGPGDKVYRSVEHAYQASKSVTAADWDMILACATPGMAKKAGRKLKLRDNWDGVKVKVMRRLLEQKFAPGSDLAAQLLATSDAELQEGNNWNDTFWGVDSRTGEGFNHLGRLLMEVRNELRPKQTVDPEPTGPEDDLGDEASPLHDAIMDEAGRDA